MSVDKFIIKLLLVVFSMGYSAGLMADVEVPMGDVHPPFPWHLAKPCEILTQDLPGYWAAKDDSGRVVFYIHIAVAGANEGHNLTFRQLVQTIDKDGYAGFSLIARGTGGVSGDLSTVTAVINDRFHEGKSYWLYIHSLCVASSGQRQTVLEVVSVLSGTENPDSEKFIFEKVADNSIFSFTE